MSLTAADAKKLTVVKLKEELAKRGLAADGKKEQLLERLLDAIQKAEEDAILNGTVDIGENITNEDVLLDGALDDLAAGDAFQAKGAKEMVEAPKENKTAETKEKPTAESVEAQLKRAQRFGLPIVGDAAKAKRAERFGSTTESDTSSPSINTEEVKRRRDERFGITAESPKTPLASNDETKTKLVSRAQRFGLPVNAQGKTLSPGSDPSKLAERAKRFGLPADDEVDEKKRARLERFGNS